MAQVEEILWRVCGDDKHRRPGRKALSRAIIITRVPLSCVWHIPMRLGDWPPKSLLMLIDMARFPHPRRVSQTWPTEPAGCAPAVRVPRTCSSMREKM
jgi:hypothetical protein